MDTLIMKAKFLMGSRLTRLVQGIKGKSSGRKKQAHRSTSHFTYGMRRNLVDVLSYRDIIGEWMKNRPRAGFGEAKNIAQALGVSTAIVSQVLGGDRQLTLEQADKMARYMELSESERRFFVLLVLRERAESPELQETLDALIEQNKIEFQNWHKFLKGEIELPFEVRLEYFSNWTFAAIHLALEIKDLRSISALSKKLELSEQVVEKNLEFLLKHGFCQFADGEYQQGPTAIYLPRGNFSKTFHTQRRLLALDRFGRDPKDIHFSGFYSIGKAAFDDFKEDLQKTIQKHSQLAADAKEPESLFCVNIDAFQI